MDYVALLHKEEEAEPALEKTSSATQISPNDDAAKGYKTQCESGLKRTQCFPRFDRATQSKAQKLKMFPAVEKFLASKLHLLGPNEYFEKRDSRSKRERKEVVKSKRTRRIIVWLDSNRDSNSTLKVAGLV